MAPQYRQMDQDTSPWTRAYEMHCDAMPADDASSSYFTSDEQQPTHDALVDVYNRDTRTTNGKRF